MLAERDSTRGRWSTRKCGARRHLRGRGTTSQQSRATRTQFVFVISEPLKSANGLREAAREKLGMHSPDPRTDGDVQL